ncbi:energy transducer TonB [Carboxylicivirga marina]|uniref:TonB family protein n=1 Tax=Carboxylicivirga marina TaxID=2800988 RepID=A0ABS1HJ67_9BACT|nr:energy transducer TonB [Carboxylicivirga marina]MBK3517712.1 TonB family protein [Carboxylicivirga marina]
MRRISYLMFLIFVIQTVRSQDTIVSYLDANWKKTKRDNAVYFRKAFKDETDLWHVKDFYINGNIQMSGCFTDKRLKKKQGYFEYFYENGTIRSYGKYDKNKREGEWKWYRKDGSKSSEERYKNNEVIQFKFWNADGSQVMEERKVFELPEFIGGEKALKSYISEKIKYPSQAILSNKSGTVYVDFVINEEGYVEDAKVKNSVDMFLDVEALRVINIMPRWIPGKHHNLPIKVSYTVPIYFVFQ